jgi:hypothetical protein
MADMLYSVYLTAASIVQQWNDQNVAAVIPPGDSTVIADGSATDGRNPLTNDQAYAIILAAQDIANYFEGNVSPGAPDGSKAKLVPVVRAEVNGSSRF